MRLHRAGAGAGAAARPAAGWSPGTDLQGRSRPGALAGGTAVPAGARPARGSGLVRPGRPRLRRRSTGPGSPRASGLGQRMSFRGSGSYANRWESGGTAVMAMEGWFSPAVTMAPGGVVEGVGGGAGLDGFGGQDPALGLRGGGGPFWPWPPWGWAPCSGLAAGLDGGGPAACGLSRLPMFHVKHRQPVLLLSHRTGLRRTPSDRPRRSPRCVGRGASRGWSSPGPERSLEAVFGGRGAYPVGHLPPGYRSPVTGQQRACLGR